MPRTARQIIGGYCYHVMSRGNGRAKVFHTNSDYLGFLELMHRANSRIPLRLLSYCLMPNHFHFVVWPHDDGDLSRWMHWLLTSHVRRYHQARGSSGRVWQGRFKAFPIQQNRHLLTVMRYVERNPVRANFVERAVDWDWSSLSIRNARTVSRLVCDSPVPKPSDWTAFVDTPHTTAEIEALRRCSAKSTPFGVPSWVRDTANRLGLESSLRGPGRPPKH